MTVADELRAEGIVLGAALTLLEQLTFKFGDLPDRVTAAVRNAPREKVRQWSLQILTADSLEEIFGR